MKRRLAVIAIASLATACGTGTGANNSQRGPASTTANSSGATIAAVTPAWLAGRWQSEGLGDCGGASDSYLAFEADGSYAFMAERGRWSLEGDRLTIEVTEAAEDGEAKAGDRNTTQVRAIGPDEAEITPANAPPSRIHRCRG
jgi:hypothetical protein